MKDHKIWSLTDNERTYLHGSFPISFSIWLALVTLTLMTQGVSANFAPHFAPSPAFVAQWIEQRFPKPQVAGPIPAEGAK